ncbi:MAG: efflux RND transporter periplasmic adaptor subunit [Sphingomonadaceae bacterium]
MRCLLIAGVALAVSACHTAPPPKPAEARIVDVAIAQVGEAQIAETVTGVGTVRLRQETALAFTSAGRVSRIMVVAGDRVAKGQLLATLDATTVNAQLGAADAEQIRAAAELRRSKTLYADGWVSKVRVDTAQAAYDAATATVRARRFATDTARIFAPSAGVVLARSVEPSQVVDAGTPIIVVGEEAGGYVLKVPVADRDAARLAAGAPAQVTIASLGTAPITGQIVQIGGRADQGTGTFEVEIGLPRSARLRSGQIGEVAIVVRDQSQARALVMPAAALFAPRAGEGFVYLVAGGSERVSLRKVIISDARDGGIHVISGLNPGDWVVVSGVDRLSDKAQVRAVKRTG